MKQKLVLIVLAIVGSTMFSYGQNKKEAVALNWLTTNQSRLNIQSKHNFEMLFSKKSIAGETFRFYQMINGVQVYNSEVVIHVSNNNQVTFNQSTYDKTVADIKTNPSISETEAMTMALLNLEVTASDIIQQDNQLFVYNELKETKLVYRIYLMAYSKTGAWEVIVDAQTGEILRAKDVAMYYHKGKKRKRKKNTSAVMATGTAMVYDTDPLTATQNAYGGQYVDNNDATNASLDAARTQVTLLDIQFMGGQYRLKGPYTEIAELDAPDKELFIQATNNFEFNRQEDGFEAANAYHHIDKSMRYINNDLGITLAPSQNGGVIRFDPHGANGADNSFYSGGSLVFGEGYVDDAEDADVILHELGHGLHDWITNGGLSQVEGLSEGSGDYWANSYKRSLGLWSNSDPARNWVFGWDGHNEFWPGRSTVYGAQYPGGLTGSIHTDGQMWATTLMEIWEDIGREKTDKAFLLGLAMTNSGTNQEQAAVAVRQAAIDMGTAQGFTCADIQAITNRFTAQGYSLPAYTCTLSVETFETASISIFPNPTNGRLTFMNLTQEHEIAVFNMLGQRVQEQTVNTSENTLDVSHLSTGTYFIKFSKADTILKFVKE